MTGLFSPHLFADRTVFITNAGPWSAAVADAFGRGGAAVAVATREEGDAPAADARLVLDTTDAAAVAEAFDAVEARLAPVDILINGPGARGALAAAATRLADWRRITGPNYDGVFFCCAEFARRRIRAEGRGWVLNLIEAPDADGRATEAAAAAGVVNLVRTLGAEWARDGLRVNGLVSRDWTAAPAPDALALYLCSPYSGFVTSAVLGVDAA